MLPDFSPLIQEFIYLKEHFSTNEYAMKSLSNNDPNRQTCVYTYNQTRGRGQIGRQWYSGTAKNISCSFRYYLTTFKVKDQFLINMAFSLAIWDFVSAFIPSQVSIKWPNDIYVADRKIAGLLIQNMVRKDTISSTILGVGININEDQFPPDLPNPIALSELTTKSYKLLDMQLYLAECVEKRIGMLVEDLRSEYLTKLFRKDITANYLIEGMQQEGIIRGIAEDGKLELELRGQRSLFNFRELEFIV